MASKPITTSQNAEISEPDKQPWRRKCGCIKTSDKLKKILNSFPSPPPPTPAGIPGSEDVFTVPEKKNETTKKCVVADSHMAGCNCYSTRNSIACPNDTQSTSQSWTIVSEMVQLLQLSVTATALAIYYIIYCYMQLVYYMLRSAIYFHNADGPMKITIGVVTLTSLVVGFNLIVRMERLFGFLY